MLYTSKSKYHELNDIFEPEQTTAYNTSMHCINETLTIGNTLDKLAASSAAPPPHLRSYHRRRNTNDSSTTGCSDGEYEGYREDEGEDSEQMGSIPRINHRDTSSLLYTPNDAATLNYPLRKRHRRQSSVSKLYHKVGGLFMSKWK